METNDINFLLEKVKTEDDSFIYDEEKLREAISKYKIAYSGIAIKILSILGGIFAGLAFLGFLFLSGAFDSEISLVILGIVLMAVSIIGDKKIENTIVDTCCIALYVIGFSSFIIGLSEICSMSYNAITSVCIALSVLSILITNNYIICLLAVLTANACLLLLFQSCISPESIIIVIANTGAMLVWVSFSEAKIISENLKFNKLFKPVRTGFFISFATGLIYLVVAPLWETSYHYLWILSLLIWPAIIYIISLILKLFEVKEKKKRILVYSCCGLILAPTLFAPFLSGCILLLLLSFYFNYKTEIALSIALLAYIICQYYYNLQLSLLVKSGILFFSGLVFLLFWLGFYQTIKKDGNI